MVTTRRSSEPTLECGGSPPLRFSPFRLITVQNQKSKPNPPMSQFNRILLIVLDGAGIGAMPDAPEWGDAGSDTFGHILESRKLQLPNLQRYGLGNIRPLKH